MFRTVQFSSQILVDFTIHFPDPLNLQQGLWKGIGHKPGCTFKSLDELIERSPDAWFMPTEEPGLTGKICDQAMRRRNRQSYSFVSVCQRTTFDVGFHLLPCLRQCLLLTAAFAE